MATNFPGAFDTVVELGPVFINVLPVVDPQRNIDADFRTNSNDAMFAVQAKLGIAGSLNPTSVDWGLLGVGGVPNLGLRFAASSADWPGAVGDTGIFHHVTTGFPAVHFAGDAANVHWDLVTTFDFGLQSAYEHVPTIVTAGGIDLAVSGSENVSFTFGAAAKQMIVSSADYLGNATPDLDGLVFVSMAARDGGLCAMQVRADATVGGVFHDQVTAVRAVVDSGSAMAAGTIIYGVSANSICQDIAAGTALGFDFWATTPVKVGAGAGTFRTYGFFADTGHTTGYFSLASSDAGFFSKNDYNGFSAENATNAAFFADSGSAYNLYMGAATTYDIFSAQAKVKFEYADAAADMFLLDASALVTGRTSTDGMLKIDCPVQTGGVAQRVVLWVADAGDNAGGTGHSVLATSRAGGPIGPLANAGELNSFVASHLTDDSDHAGSSHVGMNILFGIQSSGGGNIADTGGKVYGLRVNLPETYTVGGTAYTTNALGSPARWAIEVAEGETKLRGTFMEGPSSLNKAVLHVSQKDVNCEIITLQGTSNATPANCNLTDTSAGAVVGPGATNWVFKAMFRVNVVDDNAGVLSGTYWVPLYSVV